MTARIVVGVDGSPQSRRALDAAIEEARRRDGSVEAVHAWMPAVLVDLPEYVGIERVRDDYQAAARQMVADLMADLPTDVPVEATVVEGPAASTLIHRSDGADLLVVGTRGRGGFAGLLLGSTSHQVASHALCPVMVVPMEDEAERPAA